MRLNTWENIKSNNNNPTIKINKFIKKKFICLYLTAFNIYK